MKCYYYTFGSEHFLGRVLLKDEFVEVRIDQGIDVDPREVFMGWRGSNAFAFEYDEMSWKERVYPKYYQGKTPFIVITVEIRK